VLSDHDRPKIEKRVDSIIKDNQRFERVVVSRDEALGMFQENKFKVGLPAFMPPSYHKYRLAFTQLSSLSLQLAHQLCRCCA